jgi:hypothetical protein
MLAGGALSVCAAKPTAAWNANMIENERYWAVQRLLFDYVKSPSLRHIRDPRSVTKLAREILKVIDHASSIWKKWDAQREVVLKSAMGCWIPIDDMWDFLNRMPGPPLAWKADAAAKQ